MEGNTFRDYTFLSSRRITFEIRARFRRICDASIVFESRVHCGNKMRDLVLFSGDVKEIVQESHHKGKISACGTPWCVIGWILVLFVFLIFGVFIKRRLVLGVFVFLVLVGRRGGCRNSMFLVTGFFVVCVVTAGRMVLGVVLFVFFVWVDKRGVYCNSGVLVVYWFVVRIVVASRMTVGAIIDVDIDVIVYWQISEVNIDINVVGDVVGNICDVGDIGVSNIVGFVMNFLFGVSVVFVLAGFGWCRRNIGRIVKVSVSSKRITEDEKL